MHGYFQLGLDEASSKLTTFLLPQGKFRYLRAPMGLNASSDEWCCQSDAIIRGLPWARKIVDDTLIWAQSMDELMERTRVVLQRCQKYGVTISKKKLELGKRINYRWPYHIEQGNSARQRKIHGNPRIPTAKESQGLTVICRTGQPTGNVHP